MASTEPSCFCLTELIEKIKALVANINFKNINLVVVFILIFVVFVYFTYTTNFSIGPVRLQENLVNPASASQPLAMCTWTDVDDVLDAQGSRGVYEYGRAVLPPNVREHITRLFDTHVRPMLKDPKCALGNQVEFLDWLFVRIVPLPNQCFAYHTEGTCTNTVDHTTHNFFWRFAVCSPNERYVLHELRPMSERDSVRGVDEGARAPIHASPAELRATLLPPTVYDKSAYVSNTPDFNHPNLHNLSSEASDLFSRTKRVMGRSI